MFVPCVTLLCGEEAKVGVGRWLNLMWQMSQKIHSLEYIAKDPGSPLMCLLLSRTLEQECL